MRRGHDRPTGRDVRGSSTGTDDPGRVGAQNVGYQGEQQQGYPSETVDYRRGQQGYPSESAEYGRGATGQTYSQGSAQYGRQGAQAYPERGGYGPGQGLEPRREHGGAALTLLTGLLMAFVGITGIIRAGFFARAGNYPFYYSVRSRGITEMIVGAVLLMLGLCMLLGMHWARRLAMLALVVAAIVSFITIPFYPFWSILLLALSVFALWEVAHNHARRGLAA